MKLPVDIKYESIENHNAEHIVFILDSSTKITVSHNLIVTHDREKKVIQVPESFALRNDLI